MPNKYLAVIIEGTVSTDDDPIRRIMGPFDTYDEAWEAGDRFVEKFGRDIYNNYAEILETEAEAVADELDMEENAIHEQAEWNAMNHPEGIIIEARMEGN